jgi:hypothetical protein
MAVVLEQAGGVLTLDSVYRMTIYTFLENQMAMTSVNFLYATLTGAGGGNIGTVFQGIYTVMNSSWKAAIATAATLVGCKISAPYTKPQPLPAIITEGAVGSGGVSPLPTQVSGLGKFQTNMTGRAYRGRIYMPFPWAAAIDTDYTPTVAYQTLVGNVLSAWVTLQSITTGGSTYQFVPVIFHRKAGKSGVPVAGTWNQIINNLVPKEWATQRKRGNFGKVNKDIIS